MKVFSSPRDDQMAVHKRVKYAEESQLSMNTVCSFKQEGFVTAHVR